MLQACGRQKNEGGSSSQYDESLYQGYGRPDFAGGRLFLGDGSSYQGDGSSYQGWEGLEMLESWFFGGYP